ncbi:hypothetical protein BGZ51_006574 [Haplosporangium sp. Z 767]|nr:hypothetical protein BGZ50_006442 [Haplosporangium sp. Z 11]KAF9191854.1 hypothetical protein BGZ51_006574 [Haplosporangium sp. Z 767]
MTDNHLILFCLVDGLLLSRAFEIEVSAIRTIVHLKDLIKTKQAPAFDDITVVQITLWRVFIPDGNQSSAITIDAIDDETELNDPRARLSKLFSESPDDNTYIIVQRPPSVPAPVAVRTSTPLSGYLSDGSRPGIPLSGELHADIKKITDTFFAPGSVVNLQNAFVKSEEQLPATIGPIRGLPRAWRRGFGMSAETRPSLLFLDLLAPSTPDSASKDLVSDSILEMGRRTIARPSMCLVFLDVTRPVL